MTKAKPSEQGPYLKAALLCDTVLVEKDGTMSIIRVIDRITRSAVGPEPPEEMETFEYDFFMLVSFTSGQARGVMPIEVRAVKPSGQSPPLLQQSIIFEGEDDRGSNMVVKLRFKFSEAGVYWFKVYLSGVFLTKIPLRIVYIPQIRQKPPPSEH